MDKLTREELIAVAAHLHDESGCQCDPKYLMSCPGMANAVLQAGRVIRERSERQPQYMDNPKAIGARPGATWGYLPCGCENDGFGSHAAYRR
ncbi:MAG TPA: hypothetical protein VGH53_02540 [Streptosporangiaceae bacterium]